MPMVLLTGLNKVASGSGVEGRKAVLGEGGLDGIVN